MPRVDRLGQVLHAGRVAEGGSQRGDREGNEDGYLVARNGAVCLCVVCDGVGAAPPGHPAAELVISILRASFERHPTPDAVVDAMAHAHRAILARLSATHRGDRESDRRYHGMGATAGVALFVPGRAHLAHAGDVRIYRFHGGGLELLTMDHSLVNKYRRLRPDLRDDELAGLPQNVIIRAFGMGDELEIERRDVPTSPGEVFLLCSNGVTSTLDDGAIAAILRGSKSSATMARALLDAVCDASHPPKDNATVVVHVVSAGGL